MVLHDRCPASRVSGSGRDVADIAPSVSVSGSRIGCEEDTLGTDETYRKFRAFFDAAHEPGALDAKTKELLHIAVALALHCEP